MQPQSPTPKWYELLFEYRTLRAKEIGHGKSKLTPRSAVLGTMLGEKAPWLRPKDEARPHKLALPVAFAVGGKFAAGKLCDMTGGGMVILARRVPPAGTRTFVQLNSGNKEYTYPVRVKWSSKGKGFGVLFDGEPVLGKTIYRSRKNTPIFGIRHTAPLVA